MRSSWLIIFIISSCSVINSSRKEEPVFYLEKTACYGACPVYKLQIYKSGRLEFNGIKNTKITGNFCSMISKSKLDSLSSAFIQGNYFSFSESYTSRIKDLPSTITSFSFGGQKKQVVDYDKAPETLKMLEKMLEILADSISWKSCK